MTISSDVRKAGPFSGNDATTAFSFSFKVFSTADVLAVSADSQGRQTDLTEGVDYTVSLNANQNEDPGGTVTLKSPLATGYKLVLTSRVQNLQPTDLTNQGGFYPAVINAALDRATIQIQQLSEKLDRSAKLPITRTEDVDALLSDIVVLADNLSSVNTVAGSIGSVNTVAGVSADVSTVAGNIANINAAVADLPALSAKVSKTGDTMTGPLEVPAGASGAQVPQAQEVVSKTGGTMTGPLSVPALNGGQLAGMRNKVINGTGEINQRALTSVADDTYFIDRFYVLTESGNVTVAKLTDPESGAPFGFRLTQPDVTAKRIGFATIIESKNIRQYAGQAMNLFARVKLSAGTGIRYAIIEHAGTADDVTSDVVNNWASTTFTPSNFFIAGINILKTGVVTPGAATFGEIDDWSALGASVKNVILFVWSESTLAQDGTLEANRIQYEPGVVATPFEWRLDELQSAQRYFEETFSSVAGVAAAGGNQWAAPVYFKVQKRTTPTIAAGTAIASNNISSAVRDQVSVHGFRYVVTATAAGAFSGAAFATASAEL